MSLELVLHRNRGENERLPKIVVEIVVVDAGTVNILVPSFIYLDGGHHGDIVGNVIMNVRYEGNCGSHEFGVIGFVSENRCVFRFDAAIGVA